MSADGWIETVKCKVCGNFPLVLPVKGGRIFGCDHGKQEIGIHTFNTPQEWNEAQK